MTPAIIIADKVDAHGRPHMLGVNQIFVEVERIARVVDINHLGQLGISEVVHALVKADAWFMAQQYVAQVLPQRKFNRPTVKPSLVKSGG